MSSLITPPRNPITIVYYGPRLRETTAWLTHQRYKNRGELVRWPPPPTRTLSSIFTAECSRDQGFVTKFPVYTVPGQVIYNATRQLVLRSTDGVVFVADSRGKMEQNVESFKLTENLASKTPTSTTCRSYSI